MKNKKFLSHEILYLGLQGLHDYQEQFLNSMQVKYKVQTNNFLSDDDIKKFMNQFEHIAIHLDIDVLDTNFFHSTYFANKELVGDGSGSGKMSMDKLYKILQLISSKTDIVGLTIAEYLPFDKHKLHNMFTSIKMFHK